MKQFSVEKLHFILQKKLSKKKQESELEALFEEDFFEISENLDSGGLSDSFSWRNCYFSRQLADLLLDQEGKFKEHRLAESIELSKKNCCPLSLFRSDDLGFRQHVHRMLQAFQDASLVKIFYSIRAPFANPIASKMIRHTLFLEENHTITLREARIAVLSALFCKLRQNVGSCFATAIAIRVQEDPLQFLHDLLQLFQQGTLKRVIEGKEFIVPMNSNYGLGELKKPLFFSEFAGLPLQLSSSFSVIFPLKKSRILKNGEGQNELFEILNNVPWSLQKEILTPERIFELLLFAYYKLDPNKVRTTTIFQEKNKEILLFEKSLAMTKSAFVNLTDHALLKSWEFTLASFSEAQSQMAEMNLTTSLGLNPESPSGIGEVLQKKIQERLEAMNEELENMQHQINHVAMQLESLQRRAQDARSESELSLLQASYRGQSFDLQRIVRTRDDLHEKGTEFGSYFPKILQFIQKQYKECFQEVYDPEMQEVSVGILDDMPAGFRLCFKHGRSKPSSWTIIHDLDEFIRMVSEFFIYLEFVSAQEPSFKLFKDELPILWRALHHEIKDRSFQKDCFIRLAIAFQEPLPKDPFLFPEEVKRKPWAYVSGGQIEGLYSCYYRKQLPLNEVSTMIRSPSELLIFYLNTMRSFPIKTNQLFPKNFLSFSPTHAFLLIPSFSSFLEGIQSKEHAHTWVQNWASQARDLANLELSTQEKEKISSLLLTKFPSSYQKYLQSKLATLNFTCRSDEYHKELLIMLSYEKWAGQELTTRISEVLQTIFYEHLPFFTSNTLQDKTEKILHELSIFPEKIIAKAISVAKQGSEKIGNYQLLSAKDLLLFVQTALLGATKKSKNEFDCSGMILKAMSKFGFSLYHTILVGNTNWTKEYFGFLVNPATLEIDLWRMDITGRTGIPLSIWKPFLHGESNKKWGIILDEL